MCLSETSLIAIICSCIVAISSLITTYITLHNRSLEKYKKKQDAILGALQFLDTYCSFLRYPSEIVPERDTSYNANKMTLECRFCYENLCVTVKNKTILELFLSIVLGQTTDVMVSLNKFRNLSRKELKLDTIKFNEKAVFLSLISTEDLPRN